MREKIQNNLKITCRGADLTKISNVEFYVKQDGFFGCYEPTIISTEQMVVTIPFQHAMQLKMGKVKMQFAFVDENGIPDHSNIVVRQVREFLKEAGYDPI